MGRTSPRAGATGRELGPSSRGTAQRRVFLPRQAGRSLAPWGLACGHDGLLARVAPSSQSWDSTEKAVVLEGWSSPHHPASPEASLGTRAPGPILRVRPAVCFQMCHGNLPGSSALGVPTQSPLRPALGPQRSQENPNIRAAPASRGNRFCPLRRRLTEHLSPAAFPSSTHTQAGEKGAEEVVLCLEGKFLSQKRKTKFSESGTVQVTSPQGRRRGRVLGGPA